MFDEVSSRYDLMNDVLSAYQSRVWRKAMVSALQPRRGMHILDLAAGTGTSSEAISRRGARVTAADFSEGMLEEGRRKHAGNSLINFEWADAENLPFENDSFDAATISFGLRNVQDPKRALRELLRVTKPGGKVIICEFSTPTLAVVRGPYRFYSKYFLPRIAGLFGAPKAAYEYLTETIAEWPTQAELAEWMREAGFENAGYRNLTGGIVALNRGFVPLKTVKTKEVK